MKRTLIDPAITNLSISRQCSLLGLSRSTFYYEVGGESSENLRFMRLLDELYTATPFYGVLRMTAQLQRDGYIVNEKRIRRLLRLMALDAIYPKPNLSNPNLKPILLMLLSLLDLVWNGNCRSGILLLRI